MPSTDVGMLLEVYTNMIKSNLTVLKGVINVFTLIMYVKAARYTFRMLTVSNVH